VKDRLLDALKRSRADYADVRFDIEDATAMGYRGKEFDSVSTSKCAGGVVRACTNGGWGVAVFDSLDDLGGKVEDASRAAALVGRERTELALGDEPADAVLPANMDRDFRGVSLDDKLALITAYNEIILGADPAIESSYVSYSENFRTVHFASTTGAYFMEERPRVILGVSAIARDGALVQRAGNSVSSRTTYDAVLGFEAETLTAAKRAAALLKAPPCEGGTYTVVLDQELGGVFAHEAFGHLSEADFLYENPKMRELMYLGRDLGAKGLTIVDDGTLGRMLGTNAFDDEGTRTARTELIREGVLVGHLHSRETAAKMGERPTGNARALGRGHAPIVRMRNTYIEPGGLSFAELLSGVDNGIYALGLQGGQTMMEMFTFSAAYGHRIENGQVGELVRDVVLTGNVFETLHAIDGFGNDLKILERGGGCGKGGQSGLATPFGAPHLRIQDVVVGGR
jgi:TldD protein